MVDAGGAEEVSGDADRTQAIACQVTNIQTHTTGPITSSNDPMIRRLMPKILKELQIDSNALMSHMIN